MTDNITTSTTNDTKAPTISATECDGRRKGATQHHEHIHCHLASVFCHQLDLHLRVLFFCSLARTKNILQLREPFSMLLFTTKYPLLNLILQESAFFLFRFVVGGKTARKIFRFRCSSSILWNKWAYYSFITLWCLSVRPTVRPSICLSSCLLYYNLVFNSCWVLIIIFPFFKLNNHIHLYIYIYI